MIHSTQEAFSHSTSCITHDVLTEACTHSPFPLAVSSWQPAPARMNKLFRPFSASVDLVPSFCPSGHWHCPRGRGVALLEKGHWRKGGQPSYSHSQHRSQAGPPYWLRWKSWTCARYPQLLSSGLQQALCLDSLTDLNLNTLRTQGIGTACITLPTSTSALYLSVL